MAVILPHSTSSSTRHTVDVCHKSRFLQFRACNTTPGLSIVFDSGKVGSPYGCRTRHRHLLIAMRRPATHPRCSSAESYTVTHGLPPQLSETSVGTGLHLASIGSAAPQLIIQQFDTFAASEAFSGWPNLSANQAGLGLSGPSNAH